MKAVYDFRLFESEARGRLPDSVGVRLGELTRRVVTTPDAPEFQLVGDAHRALTSAGGGLIASWNVRRSYGRTELDTARIFRLQVSSTFGPSGEECGTTYDEGTVCAVCGSGRSQMSPLRLRSDRIPSRDVSTTIARETIATEALVSAAMRDGITGFETTAIGECGSGTIVPDHRQLHVVGERAAIVPPAEWGNTPFDRDTEYRCPLGHVGGLNLLSEAFVAESSWPDQDVVLSDRCEGRTSGLLRPAPIVLISARLYRWLKANRVTGWTAEVAHLV